MLRLPVSGIEAELRPPSGADDLLLCEASAIDVTVAVEFARRIGCNADGSELDWSELPLTDLDALLLGLRQAELGDLIVAETACPLAECGKKVDASFRISAFLEHHKPSHPAGVEAVGGGWYRLSDNGAEFRAPRASDLLAAANSKDPASDLAARCTRPVDMSARVRRQVERAMALIAPTLCEDLDSACVECGSPLKLRFDPQNYVLTELRDAALGIHDDVHLLASAYHWREADILALPRSRRSVYVGMVREARGA